MKRSVNDLGISLFKSVSLILGALFLCSLGFAAEDAATSPGQTSATEKLIEKSGEKTNSVPGSEEVDSLLTNNNLRALSGSTSRWSIASQYNYNGGSIASPLSQDRPDISNASGQTTKSDLDGSISAKYSINAKNALLAGIGIRWIAPLSTGHVQNYNGTTFDAINPYIQYQYIYKWAGIQSVLQFTLTQWTQADQTAIGSAQQFNLDQENMYEIGSTNLSVGVSTSVQYQTFNKSGSFGDPSNPDTFIPNLAAVQSIYSFNFAPVLEFNISDKLTLRTLVDLFQFEHYAANPNILSFNQDTVYQSIGLGISITRDIYLYPNIQFLPAQMQASLTNVGLSATVNLF